MGADPEHLGTGPWEVQPVELAQPLWSQAAVVMGVLGQGEWSPVDAAATAVVAALRAAPAAVAGNEEVMTSDIWGSPSPDWGAAGWDQLHHPWVPPLGLEVWQEKEPLLVVQEPLLRAVGIPLGWLRSCHCWCYWYCHHHSPGQEMEPHLEWGWPGQEEPVPALPVLFLVLGLVLVKELKVWGVLWGQQVVALGQEGRQVGQQALL